jgi:hypothetical protein
MANIFNSKDVMPPKDNSPDVERTALTMSEAQRTIVERELAAREQRGKAAARVSEAGTD